MHGNRRVARRLAAFGQHRLQARQGIDDIAGAMPRTHGQMPPEQEEQDKHADRIEIDLVAANEDVDHAGQVDQGDGQRHRRIHRQASRAPLAHGAAKERLCRIQHDRSGDQEADPAEELAHRRIDAVEHAGIQGHGHHHRLHGAESGDNQALEHGARFTLALRIDHAGSQRMRQVAESRQRGKQARQLDPARIECEADPTRQGIDADIEHAIDAAQGAFDQPGAGRATQAIHQHDHLGAISARAAHMQARQRRPIPGGKVGDAVVALRRLAAQAVVISEAERLDPFRGGLAAGAADRVLPALHAGEDRRRGRIRFAAMKTRLRVHDAGP